MVQAPLGDDAATTAHDTGEAAVGEVHILQADATVDGEIVDALLALLNERVAIDLPAELLHMAFDLLQCLVHGHGAHGDGTVAQDPLTGGVDVGTGREVHDGVATPLAAPDGFLHLLLDAGVVARVAQVGIDLDQEVGTDDHGLALGVLLVGRNHGTACCHLLAHKLGGDIALDAHGLAVHVLADGHILHLVGDDALLGQRHLGVGRLATGDPGGTELGQPLLQVDLVVGVAIGAAGVVDGHTAIILQHTLAIHVLHGGREGHLAHGHAQILVDTALNIDFLR